MSWLKLARWFMLGTVGLSAAAACGGRGNLASGGGDAAGGDGSFSFGGANVAGSLTTGGTSAGGTRNTGGTRNVAGGVGVGGTPIGVGGTPIVAGNSGVGGDLIVGGAIGVGGSFPTAGAPPVCIAGSTSCKGNALVFCNASGTGAKVSPCGNNQVCVQQGNTASCQALLCQPNGTQCDDSGRYVELCSGDGLNQKPIVDCLMQGQRCRDGVCRSLICQPGQPFCDKTGLRVCNADGSDSVLKQACGANQYCDVASLSCKQGVCAPGKPACNGMVAATCNGNGSGYLPGGEDCKLEPDRQCVDGACLCAPSLADCDGQIFTGCEAKISTDPNNCTGCRLVCSSNHVPNPSCDDGCDGACEAGYADCNGDKLSDGCETGTNTDLKNCGGCGLACSPNHITATCTQAKCDGKCAANFADCNGNKQKDGCESDARIDAQNCGGCGVACSANHVKPNCAAGTCNGACTANYTDCNGNKQVDGCEINTSTDALNCGGCGFTCGSGETCQNGKCSSLYTFSGVAQKLPIASLTGWTQCLLEGYGASVTTVAKVKAACSGSKIMLACRVASSSILQVAAYAPRADVFFDTMMLDTTHSANGVGWYFSNDWSWGFAGQGDVVDLNSCDVAGTNPDKRLCWHTTGGVLQSGWRCGSADNLFSADYERLMFTAP